MGLAHGGYWLALAGLGFACASDDELSGEFFVKEHYVGKGCVPTMQVDGPERIFLPEVRSSPCPTSFDCAIPFTRMGDELVASVSTTESIDYSPGVYGCKRWLTDYRVYWARADATIAIEISRRFSAGTDGCPTVEDVRAQTSCDESELLIAERRRALLAR